MPVIEKLETGELGTLLAVIVQAPVVLTVIVTGPKNADVPVEVKPFALYVPTKTIGAGAEPPKTLPVRVNCASTVCVDWTIP